MKIVDKRGNVDNPQDGDYTILESKDVWGVKIAIPMKTLYDLLANHWDQRLRMAVAFGCERALRQFLPDVLPVEMVDGVVRYIIDQSTEEDSNVE